MCLIENGLSSFNKLAKTRNDNLSSMRVSNRIILPSERCRFAYALLWNLGSSVQTLSPSLMDTQQREVQWEGGAVDWGSVI